MEEEMDTSTLAKGTIWTFAAQMMLKLFSFLYLIILAKFFSAEEVGIFYFALSIVSVISIFTDLGLNQSLPRYVPYLYGKGRAAILRSFMKVIFFTGGFLSLLFSLLLFFSAPFVASALGRPEITLSLQVLAFLPFISELASLGSGFLVGRKLIKNFQIIYNLQGITKLLFTLILGFLIAFNSVSLSYAYLISFIPLIIGYSYFMVKDLGSLRTKGGEERVEKSLIIEIFYFGLLLSLISAFYIVASSTDRFMLGVLGGEKAMENVGIYSVVTAFAGLLLLPFSAVLTIFFPMVSELFGREKMEEIKKITAVAIKWSIIIGAPFFILLTGFADILLRLFYEPEYAAATNVFILYLISYGIFSLSLLPMKVIAAMRRLDIELRIAGICAVVNIILNWFFIPQWGMDGAAFATLFSFFLMALLVFYYSQKLFGFKFPINAYKPLIAAVLAFVLLYLFRYHLISFISAFFSWQAPLIIEGLGEEVLNKLIKLVVLGILFAVCMAVYLALLIFSKSFEATEFVIIEKAMRRVRIPEAYIKKIISVFGGIGAN
ncbi:MAG: flippase [Candidatus Bilamarchaeaceae archaeon]